MIPRWESRNPRFWYALAVAWLTSCATACGGELGPLPPDDGAADASADVELCVCTQCGDNVKVPCADGGEQ
ncbi:MAG: hypothetical protein ACHQC8_06505 [Solirubrobacterales bacterium]